MSTGALTTLVSPKAIIEADEFVTQFVIGNGMKTV